MRFNFLVYNFGELLNINLDVSRSTLFQYALHLAEVCRVLNRYVRHLPSAYLFARLAVVIDNQVNVAMLTQQLVHLGLNLALRHGLQVLVDFLLVAATEVRSRLAVLIAVRTTILAVDETLAEVTCTFQRHYVQVLKFRWEEEGNYIIHKSLF